MFSVPAACIAAIFACRSFIRVSTYVWLIIHFLITSVSPVQIVILRCLHPVCFSSPLTFSVPYNYTLQHLWSSRRPRLHPHRKPQKPSRSTQPPLRYIRFHRWPPLSYNHEHSHQFWNTRHWDNPKHWCEWCACFDGYLLPIVSLQLTAFFFYSHSSITCICICNSIGDDKQCSPQDTVYTPSHPDHEWHDNKHGQSIVPDV